MLNLILPSFSLPYLSNRPYLSGHQGFGCTPDHFAPHMTTLLGVTKGHFSISLMLLESALVTLCTFPTPGLGQPCLGTWVSLLDSSVGWKGEVHYPTLHLSAGRELRVPAVFLHPVAHTRPSAFYGHLARSWPSAQVTPQA